VLGRKYKRNTLYISIFNSHKWHIIFPRRQGAQQVPPLLVPGPSPTKSGHFVTSSLCDGPAKVTCRGSQSAAHRESLRTEQWLADWEVWHRGARTLCEIHPASCQLKWSRPFTAEMANYCSLNWYTHRMNLNNGHLHSVLAVRSQGVALRTVSTRTPADM
jgi:hypothetical protein